jgi:hypothetical protein
MAAVSVYSNTERGAVVAFGVAGTEGAAAAAGWPACRCFSQQGQA